MKKLTAILSAVLMLTACAETPKDLKSSGQEKESSPRAESTSAAESITPSEDVPENISPAQLKAADNEAAARIKSRSYDNIKFAETFTVNAAEAPELGVYEAEKKPVFEQDAEKIIAAYFGDGFDRSKIQKNGDSNNPEIAAYEQNGLRIMITPTSFCIQNTAMQKHRTFSSGDELVQQYEVTPAFSDEKLTFGNAEAEVGKLADMNKSFFDKLAACGYDYRPFTVTALNSPSGDSPEPTVVMLYNEYFKGIPVFNMCYTPDSGETPDFNYSLIGCNDVVFAGRDSIDSILVNVPYGEVRQTSKPDSILSPDKAVELVSKALAEYLDLTALRLDLVYVPILPDGAAEDNSKAALTPYWLLSFGLKPFCEQYALVNAQTGQVTYFEPKGV